MFRKTFLVYKQLDRDYIRHRRDAAIQQQHTIMLQKLFALHFVTDTAMLNFCIIVL